MSINSINELISFFAAHQSTVYARDHYDRFLKDYPLEFKIPALHITGTNGKGSTATFLRNIYQYRFKKVGLFTSPALDRFQEMIYVNQEEIRDDYILKFFATWQVIFDQYQLTAFEMQTLLAFHYFMDTGCDFAIIEVGMGGKIDATNIFTPILSLITNISLEHQAYLGPTLADIARHKSGIIKANTPVLVGHLPPSAREVVVATAQALSAPLHDVQPINLDEKSPTLTFDYGSHVALKLSMTARYQMENAAMAVAAYDLLSKRYPIEENKLKQALYQTFMPGRLEVIKQTPLIVIDGAHNPGGMTALVKAFTHQKYVSIYVLFAAFKDKDVMPMLATLSSLSKHIYLTSFPHPRARKKADYPASAFPFIDDYQIALDALMKGIPANGVLLITGSLAFVGLVRKRLI